jgi:hypothetical protein
MMPPWATVVLTAIGVIGTLLATRLQQRHSRAERIAREKREDAARAGAVLAALTDLIDEADPDLIMALTPESQEAALERVRDLRSRVASVAPGLLEIQLMHGSQEVRDKAADARSRLSVAMNHLGGLAAMGPMLYQVTEGIVKARERAFERRDEARTSLVELAELLRRSNS